MTIEIESAWPRYPDYRIDLVPCGATGQVWLGDTLVAESEECLVLEETKHVDRLYFPKKDARWELFVETDHHTICPFKGQADYWSLIGTDPVEENVVWTYRMPFPEVAGIEGYVCFYHERTRTVLNERWGDGSVVTTRFPSWGDETDLLRLIDVEPAGDGRFLGPAYGDTPRNVVEGGQLLADAVVAASKVVPGQRVTSASMIFSKAAAFDEPVDLEVEVLRGGRTFSTVEVRVSQEGSLRSAGLLLMDVGAPEVIRHSVAMPDVAGPEQAVPFDFGVTGRELRVVDAAYDADPDRVGPPELYVWARFRDAPAEPYLHAALLSQSATHWTIAAAMLPHPGFGEANAHVTLSTGIMKTTIAFHDEVDVTEWLLYANPAIWSGRGLAQGEGRVFTRDGRLVASYTVQAMIRGFEKEPAAMGHDFRTAM
jgi:acyl-CoA thioesterase II